MKFQVVVYQARFFDGTIIDNGISLHTGFWNGLGWFIRYPKEFFKTLKLLLYRIAHIEIRRLDTGECFTSTMRGDNNGTVIRHEKDVLTDKTRWKAITLEVEDSIFNYAWENAKQEAMNNKGYDKKCIGGFFLPWRLHSIYKNICSEAVQKFLKWCGFFRSYHVWSPLRLVWKILRLDESYKLEDIQKDS